MSGPVDAGGGARDVRRVGGLVLDDRLAVVGTSNLDQQSLQHSYEVNLIVEGGGVPEELSAMVRSDIDEAAEVTAATGNPAAILPAPSPATLSTGGKKHPPTSAAGFRQKTCLWITATTRACLA